MRRYILALLAALGLVVGALAINQNSTEPSPALRPLLPNPHDLRLR
jgi:hypothetical protein